MLDILLNQSNSSRDARFPETLNRFQTLNERVRTFFQIFFFLAWFSSTLKIVSRTTSLSNAHDGTFQNKYSCPNAVKRSINTSLILLYFALLREFCSFLASVRLVSLVKNLVQNQKDEGKNRCNEAAWHVHSNLPSCRVRADP